MIVSKLKQAEKLLEKWRWDCEFCGQNSKGTWYYYSDNCSLHCINTNELGMLGTPVKTWFGWGYTKEMIENIIEQEKPRTKVVYEKVDTDSGCLFSLYDEWDSLSLYRLRGGEYEVIAGTKLFANEYANGTIYRKVEKEIDWREEVKRFFGRDDLRDYSLGYVIDRERVDAVSKGFIGMCHLVASLTDKPE